MSDLKFYALAFAAVVASLLGLYNTGRKAGEKAEKLKQQIMINKVKDISDEIDEVIDRTDSDDIRNGLRLRWTRRS